MKTKHTPGPWEIGPQEFSRVKVYEKQQGSRRIVADCDLNELREMIGYRPEAEANARLIAAAPDLLAAVEALLRLPGISSFAADLDSDAVKLAERAINKATGQ